jgi:hypothetical protein
MRSFLTTVLEAFFRFRGSALDQLGGMVVIVAFVAFGPLFGPVGCMTAGVMAVIGLIALPFLWIGFIEALHERAIARRYRHE